MSNYIESCIDAFENAWRAGSVPTIADFLSTDPSLSSDDARQLVWQLVAVDLEYRWRRKGSELANGDALGLKATLTCYAKKLPALSPIECLPAWLVAEEYRVRQLWGDRPNHDQFLAAYPAQFPTLLHMLLRIDRELAADGAGLVVERQPYRPAHPDPRAPLPFTDYLIHQHLGTGGMGKVYRATQRSLGRPVAIKSLLRTRQGDPRAVEQFLQEARIVSQLRHPNIIGVHGLGRFPGGGYFLVMDLVEGADLATRLQAGALPVAEAVRITADVAGAIQHAHEQGVIHCDLKPANVLLDSSGRVFVTDFGLAALLGHHPGVAGAGAEPPVRRSPGVEATVHVLGGTYGYLAPELADSMPHEPTVAIDVYGLGAILYSLLHGSAPQAEVQWRADIPKAIKEACQRCLIQQPTERFSTAAEVGRALADGAMT